MSCCRRIVQLCRDCLLIVYQFAADAKAAGAGAVLSESTMPQEAYTRSVSLPRLVTWSKSISFLTVTLLWRSVSRSFMVSRPVPRTSSKNITWRFCNHFSIIAIRWAGRCGPNILEFSRYERCWAGQEKKMKIWRQLLTSSRQLGKTSHFST